MDFCRTLQISEIEPYLASGITGRDGRNQSTFLPPASNELCPKPDRDPDIVRILIFHHLLSSSTTSSAFVEEKKRWEGNQKSEIVRLSCFPFLRKFCYISLFQTGFQPLLSLSRFLPLLILSAPFQCPFAYFVRRRRLRRRPDITFQFLMNQKMERKRCSISD